MTNKHKRMGTKKHNYSRFYAIASAKGIDLEQFKEDIISEFTHGRTTSLKDMKDAEYEEMCDFLQDDRRQNETREAYFARRRRARSAVLYRIQKLGIDTTDFSKVNAFCQNRRIAGKPFGVLTPDELEALIPKLESMLRKPKSQRVVKAPSMPMFIYFRPNQIPN